MQSFKQWRRGRVIAVEEIADAIRAITFEVDDLQSSFDPGSHTTIRVWIDGQPATRTYTVIPSPPGTLRIAVKRHPNSRGGSAWIFTLSPDDPVDLTEPENRFSLSWRAPEYLLIAGGIGVTPIFGMAQALLRKEAPVRMIYAARNRSQMAFLEPLQSLLGERLDLVLDDEGHRLDLEAEFSRLSPNGEVYICGPLGLLEAAKHAWKNSGRSMGRLRYEVFGDSGRLSEKPFSVEVAGLNARFDVASDQSLLDALLKAGVDMVFDCQRGECGLCAVDIVACDRDIDHRDVFFSPEERQDNHRMCACVSRADGGRLVIDTGFRTQNTESKTGPRP